MVLTLAALLLSGCKSRAVEEAREVIAVADSLRAEGQGYTDSVVIAEAYNTLEKWQYIYPTDYVHACYHYGRLLRNNDDPVAAMQVFINGTHSRTKDYHILGRIYSNMGSISHLAGEYQLAYDMYSRSADLFLQNGDTLLYYYGLNNMAVECAVQGEKEETMNMVRLIRMKDDESSMIVATCLPLAEVYFKNRQYDSVICYTHEILKNDSNNVTALLITAQSYSFLHVGDSAVHYAKKVLANTTELNNINNALYILTNDDASKDKDAIKETAAARSDIQKLIEIRQGKLSQATQLLVQDLNRESDYKWLYSVGITIFVVLVIIVIVFSVTQKRREANRVHLEQVKEQIEQQTNEQLALIAKNNDLRKLNTTRQRDIFVQLDIDCAWLANLTNEQLMERLKWTNYAEMSSVVNSRLYGFIDKLYSVYPSLKEREIRMCVLVLIGINNPRCAEVLPYAPSGIRKYKSSLAKKMGISCVEMRSDLIKVVYK